MKVEYAKIIAKRFTGIDIKVNNGIRDFIVNIDKRNLTYENFKNMQMDVKVYTLIRNCCTGKSLALFETGKSKEEFEEIKELIDNIDSLIGNEIKAILK
ncbi:MAG: hypothetical protein ACRC41_11760 [Sarcina sp.]